MKNNCFKRTLLALTCMAMTCGVMGQELSSAYFTNDFKYRHDLNPVFANEGYYVAIPVLGNFGVNIQGNFGLGDILFKDPASGKYNRTFMHPDVSVTDALAGFKDKNRILMNNDLTLISVGFPAFEGYNTVELRQRTSAGVQLPYELFLFAKDLRNTDYHIDNISARATSYTELALGHSHQLTDDLRIGAKLKVLLGVGRANLKVDNLTASLVGDQWELQGNNAQAEINMKGVEFVNVQNQTYSDGQPKNYVDLGETKINNPIFSGFGLGVDLGAEYRVLEDLKVSAAVTDLGFISWSNNYLLKQKNNKFTFDGFHDIQVNDNNGTSFSDQGDAYSDQLSDFFNFVNMGDQGTSTSMIQATALVAAEYRLPMYQQLSFGLLGRHRFAGDFSWTEGRLSANWEPLKWLDGGINVAVSDFGVSAGWVVNFHPNGFNFFIGMDRIFGKMTKEFIPLNSNAQFSIGMNVAWGGNKDKGKKSKSTSSQQNYVW